MAGTGELESDPLFLGLTRPPMLFGVSYMFAMANLLFCIMCFIVFDTGLQTFLMLPMIHGVGYYFSAKEPLFIELFMIKQSKCSKAQKNRLYHGSTNSYDVL